MKALLTSVLTLALGGLFLLPETAAAASSADATGAGVTTLTAHSFFWGSNRRPARKIKRSQGKRHQSSAARAHAKRNRRPTF